MFSTPAEQILELVRLVFSFVKNTACGYLDFPINQADNIPRVGLQVAFNVLLLWTGVNFDVVT